MSRRDKLNRERCTKCGGETVWPKDLDVPRAPHICPKMLSRPKASRFERIYTLPTLKSALLDEFLDWIADANLSDGDTITWTAVLRGPVPRMTEENSVMGASGTTYSRLPWEDGEPVVWSGGGYSAYWNELWHHDGPLRHVKRGAVISDG